MAERAPTTVGDNVDDDASAQSDARNDSEALQRVVLTLVTVLTSMGAFVAYFITTDSSASANSDPWFYILIPAVGMAPVVGTILLTIQKGERERTQEARISRSLEEIKKDPSDFGALLEFNRGLIEKYHFGTRRRATMSFWAGLCAMMVGLGVLVYGAIAIFEGSDATELSTNQRIVAATFSTVTGAVAAYVTRTFMLAHSRALDDLSAYFRQPLVTSYLLAAERIAGDISKDRQGEISERERISMNHLNGVIARTLGIAEQEANRHPSTQDKRLGTARRTRIQEPTTNGADDDVTSGADEQVVPH